MMQAGRITGVVPAAAAAPAALSTKRTESVPPLIRREMNDSMILSHPSMFCTDAFYSKPHTGTISQFALYSTMRSIRFAHPRPTLEKVNALFGPWMAAEGCHSAPGMKSSKFEKRVVDILAVLGISTDKIVREVVVPVKIPDKARRILDRRAILVPATSEVADFQKHDVMELRFDMVWVDEERDALMVLEVDGSQHAKTHSWFNGTTAVPGVSDTTAPPRPQCRDMIKDELVSRALALHPGKIVFYRVSPKFERDTHTNNQTLLRNLVTWITDPTTNAAHLNPGIFAGMLEDGDTTASVSTAPTAPLPFRRSSSEPRQRKQQQHYPQPTPEEERKMRTAYNRWCKIGKAEKEVAAISFRQRVSDSRKRPRDDQGNVYDPKWFRDAMLWQEKNSALVRN